MAESKQQPLELERAIHWLGLMGNADAEEAVLLIHGFGANTNHWRFNQPVLAEQAPTYASTCSASVAVINPTPA